MQPEMHVIVVHCLADLFIEGEHKLMKSIGTNHRSVLVPQVIAGEETIGLKEFNGSMDIAQVLICKSPVQAHDIVWINKVVDHDVLHTPDCPGFLEEQSPPAEQNIVTSAMGFLGRLAEFGIVSIFYTAVVVVVKAGNRSQRSKTGQRTEGMG